ncbi:MAG: hypothetical protein AB8B68_02395 [Rickettsiaceae bacterium]
MSKNGSIVNLILFVWSFICIGVVAFPLGIFSVVMQILERLPKKNNRQTMSQKILSETLYYAWKLGTIGILPSLVSGKSLIGAGKESIFIVKERLGDIAKLRIGYSVLNWIVGISAYIGTIFFFVVFNELLPQRYEVYGLT